MRVPEIVLGFLLATALWALVCVLGLPNISLAWVQKWQTLAGIAAVLIVGLGLAFRHDEPRLTALATLVLAGGTIALAIANLQ